MKILLVGAGAVGQVYGYHLAEGGAEVTFQVRPKYVAELAEGLTLFEQSLVRKTRLRRFERFEVVTAADPDDDFDQIWLCVSSTALRKGDWLERVCKLSGTATIVVLQPGLSDRQFVAQHVDGSRIVSGMISMVAYQGPLKDELPEPGLAYWLPPLSPSPFGGPDKTRVDAVVAALERGGCAAKHVPNVSLMAAAGSAILMPHLVALEGAGWSFSALRREWLGQAAAASREALAVTHKAVGASLPWWTSLVSPWPMRLVLLVSEWFAPMPLETYMAYHFTKTGDQTRAMIAEYVAVAEQETLSSERLASLANDVYHGLDAADGAAKT